MLLNPAHGCSRSEHPFGVFNKLRGRRGDDTRSAPYTMCYPKLESDQDSSQGLWRQSGPRGPDLDSADHSNPYTILHPPPRGCVPP